MTATAELVLASEHLTGDEVVAMLSEGLSGYHLRRMRQLGNLLAVRLGRRGYLYPAFQVDREMRRVDPVVTRVNRVLLARGSMEDAIAWWLDVDGTHAVPRAALLGTATDLEAAARSWRPGRRQGVVAEATSG